jgi:YHS domain-containing protein
MEVRMTRFAKMLILIIAVSFVFVMANAADQKADDMVKCPVSGKEIKKSEAKGSYEYQGKTYYFCCENCKDAFLKDPEKYVQQDSQEGQMHAHNHAEDSTIDPVCGMKVKKEEAKATYEYKGRTYYFCTEACKEKFIKNPEEYVKADEERVICPVSGEKISVSEAAGSYEYNGKTYYFCCDMCKEKFLKDPEKYTKKERFQTRF